MADTWGLLKKELAWHNILLTGRGECRYRVSDGTVKTDTIKNTISAMNAGITGHKRKMKELWRKATDLLFEEGDVESFSDDMSIDLFVFSVKDAIGLIHCFQDMDGSAIKDTYEYILSKDASSFSRNQIQDFPNYKVSIDWIFRLIQKMYYVRNLLRLSLRGSKRVSEIHVKTAAGVSGPWANLDLPMLERVFPWADVEEETRGRSRDIRKQRRYRKGFENYNNDGRVGEGHYWRELRNEPFSWYDRKTEDPYYQRYQLTRN